MSKSSYCKNCHAWGGAVITRPGGEQFGICDHIIVKSKIIQDAEDKIMQEGTLYTEATFGCIYFRENSGVLIDISAIVKDQLKQDGYKTK